MPGGESYMKKAIIILMSILLITSFAACRNGDAETAGTTVPENTTAKVQPK